MKGQSVNELLDACVRTRRIAAETFEAILREVLASDEPVSEAELCRRWLAKLREHESLHPDGWYTPPPHGMFAQFATDTDPSRLYHESNRPPEAWPRDDIFLDRKRGILTAYASPVDRKTGMIGDFGITLYFGDNQDIQALLSQIFAIDIALFDVLRPDMTLAEVTKQAMDLIETSGLRNAVASVNDPVGTNIGHTFPASDSGWSEQELGIINSEDWTAAANLISKKRRFVGYGDAEPIGPNIIHTIEPRPMMAGQPDLPMTCLHTIVVWQDGQKKLITNFDTLFKLAGMGYMPRTPGVE